MASMITRFGKFVPADDAFTAWTSGNLSQMLDAMTIETNEIDRHHLLQSVARALYRQRTDPAQRAKLLDVAAVHLGEMEKLIEALRRDDVANKERSRSQADLQFRKTGVPQPSLEAIPGGAIPVIETFLLSVRVLCEDGRYQEAKEVWRRAAEVGYLSVTGLLQEEASVDRRRKRNEARQRSKPSSG